MKKKMVLTAAAVALVGTLAVGGTLAWFTDTETATNVVTTGNIDITLTEDGKNDGKVIEGGLEYTDITPGKTYDKVVTVDNVGKNDAYVRATIKVTSDNELILQGLLGKKNPAFSLTDLKPGQWSNEILTDAETGKKYVEYVAYYTDTRTETDKEGQIFEAGAPAWTLFTGVDMPWNMGNEYENSMFKIQVTVDAIQVDNLLDTSSMEAIFGTKNHIDEYTEFDLNKSKANDKVGEATASQASK